MGGNAGTVTVYDGEQPLVEPPVEHRGPALMDIVLRATVIFFGLYLLVRLMGKRELAQMTPFELIVLVVIGDLIQQGVTQNDFSLTGALLAISTFAFWALVMSWASYLSPWAERLLEGEPHVIVRDGELLRGNLRRNRLTRPRSNRRCGWRASRTCATWPGPSSSRAARSASSSASDDGGEEPPPQPKAQEDDGAA